MEARRSREGGLIGVDSSADRVGQSDLAVLGAPHAAQAWLRGVIGPEGDLDLLPADGRGVAEIDPGRHSCVLVWHGRGSPGGAALARGLRREPHLRWMVVVGIAERDDEGACGELIDALVDDVFWAGDPSALVLLRLRNLLSARETEERVSLITREHSQRIEERDKALETAEGQLLALREVAALARLSDRMSHELRSRVTVVDAAAHFLSASLGDAARLVVGVQEELKGEDVPVYVALLSELLTAELDPYRPDDGRERSVQARRFLERFGAGPDQAVLAQRLAAARVSADLRERSAALWDKGMSCLELALLALGSRAASRGLIEATAALSRTIEQLRCFSLEQGPVRGLDLRDGIDLVLSLMSYDLGGPMAVRRSYAEEIPRVRANPAELNAVWTHLFEEAARQTRGRGVLDVRVDRAALGGRPAVRVDVLATAASGVPAGTSGETVSAEALRARSARRVCVEMLARAGGQLLTERAGNGTRFTVVIPAEED